MCAHGFDTRSNQVLKYSLAVKSAHPFMTPESQYKAKAPNSASALRELLSIATMLANQPKATLMRSATSSLYC